jgi:prepilin-type N-terminal cleavage/methylation domain-containing protein
VQISRGFTLIELLVVVAIIGILAAVGVTAFNGFVGMSKVSTMKANHFQAVKEFKTLLYSCETTKNVSLISGPNGERTTFACSTGASNLQVQFTAHFFWGGYRNVWNKTNCCAVAGDSRMVGYMIGYSCDPNPWIGFMNICPINNNRGMDLKTNIGTATGGNEIINSTIDIY